MECQKCSKEIPVLVWEDAVELGVLKPKCIDCHEKTPENQIWVMKEREFKELVEKGRVEEEEFREVDGYAIIERENKATEIFKEELGDTVYDIYLEEDDEDLLKEAREELA